ncbi:hypothetical protein FGIG_11935 [Fasciola gigantica]|uniref:Uncharacterized protein n=1 Tax=Fasciola gigantica TaxID=46835 RepID=A0A504YN08_FASGI|nr:hypothetical protein FGIG_11935 [Fasciola gigantica]
MHLSGPPAPPVTPNSQLSTDSVPMVPVVTSSGLSTSGMVGPPVVPDLACSGTSVMSANMPSATPLVTGSGQAKAAHSKFKVETVTVASPAALAPNLATSTVSTAPSARNPPRVTQSNNALPLSTAAGVHGISTASSSISSAQVTSSGPP